MKTDINTIEINGVAYVRADSVKDNQDSRALNEDGLCLVRSESAGVFFGHVVEHKIAFGVVVMQNARRVWYWSGAASLSQLAMDGTAKPNECKFPVAVPLITIAKVIEVIPLTAKAAKSLTEVPIWKQ